MARSSNRLTCNRFAKLPIYKKKKKKMNTSTGTRWMSGTEAWLVIHKINPLERQALYQTSTY